jgi:uncharacterized protein
VITTGQFTPFSIISVDHAGNFSTFSPELLAMKSNNGDFVFRDSFMEAEASPKFKRIYGDILAGVGNCQRECGYFDLCGGGAPANKYYENGSFASSETMYCRMTKKSLVDIMLDDLEHDHVEKAQTQTDATAVA